MVFKFGAFGLAILVFVVAGLILAIMKKKMDLP